MKQHVKVDRIKLNEAIAYRKLINKTSFEDLDLSEYPEIKNYSEEEIKELLFTGLNNVDIIGIIQENSHL